MMKQKRAVAILLVVTILFSISDVRLFAETKKLINDNSDFVYEGYFEGHRYQLIDISMAWKEAKIYCEERGGYLCCITSENEQKFIESLVNNGVKNQYWLDGYCTNENNIAWITDEAFNYTNWNFYDFNSNRNESYISIYRGANAGYSLSGVYNLNDVSNNENKGSFDISNYGIICEWSENNTAEIDTWKNHRY